MPAKSQAQFKLAKGICTGSIAPGAMSRKVACEMVSGHQSPKGLPPRAKPKK